jgi:hypothetical protein
MKVFVNGKDLSNLKIDYDSSHNQKMIYSNEGIFCFKHNKLYLLESIKEETELVPFKDISFLIDKSEILCKDTIYHIPYDHIFCEETIFKKNIDNGLIFVKKVYFDQVEYYFEIEGKLESFMFAKMFRFVF